MTEPSARANDLARHFYDFTLGMTGTQEGLRGDEVGVRQVLETVQHEGLQDQFEQAVRNQITDDDLTLLLHQAREEGDHSDSVVSAIIIEETSGSDRYQLLNILRPNTVAQPGNARYFADGTLSTLDLSNRGDQIIAGSALLFIVGLTLIAAPVGAVAALALAGAAVVMGGINLVQGGTRYAQAQDTDAERAASFQMGSGLALVVQGLLPLKSGLKGLRAGATSTEAVATVGETRLPIVERPAIPEPTEISLPIEEPVPPRSTRPPSPPTPTVRDPRVALIEEAQVFLQRAETAKDQGREPWTVARMFEITSGAFEQAKDFASAARCRMEAFRLKLSYATGREVVRPLSAADELSMRRDLLTMYTQALESFGGDGKTPLFRYVSAADRELLRTTITNATRQARAIERLTANGESPSFRQEATEALAHLTQMFQMSFHAPAPAP